MTKKKRCFSCRLFFKPDNQTLICKCGKTYCYKNKCWIDCNDQFCAYDKYPDLYKLDNNKSKSKSITSSSTARSSNRSLSLSESKKQGLPPLPNKTREEILQDVLDHSKEERDMISLREFSKMKKNDLQLVIRIGPKTHNKQNTYSVRSIYKKIKSDTKANLVAKDPLNPAHTITDAEMIDIEEKMQYIKRGTPRPDHRELSGYPKVELLFDENGNWPSMMHGGRLIPHPGFYSIIIRHTIGNRATDSYWGTIKYIETADPDLNTGIIIEALRKIHDEGRLLYKTYAVNRVKYVPRVHINKNFEYWETDPIRKLELMKHELETYYRFNRTTN